MTARSLNYDEIDIITRLQFHLINRISFNTHALLSGGERARILRSFLIALVGSPWLLFIGPARQIISLEVTLAAIVLGVIFGIVTAIELADVDIQDVNDVTTSVVALVGIYVATIVLWLIVPHQYIGTILQFTIAFMWTVLVTQLLHHRYWVPEPN